MNDNWADLGLACINFGLGLYVKWGRLVRGMEMEFPSGIYHEGGNFLVGKYPMG
jgi:hypothetical protein